MFFRSLMLVISFITLQRRRTNKAEIFFAHLLHLTIILLIVIQCFEIYVYLLLQKFVSNHLQIATVNYPHILFTIIVDYCCATIHVIFIFSFMQSNTLLQKFWIFDKKFFFCYLTIQQFKEFFLSLINKHYSGFFHDEDLFVNQKYTRGSIF